MIAAVSSSMKDAGSEEPAVITLLQIPVLSWVYSPLAIYIIFSINDQWLLRHQQFRNFSLLSFYIIEPTWLT